MGVALSHKLRSRGKSASAGWLGFRATPLTPPNIKYSPTVVYTGIIIGSILYEGGGRLFEGRERSVKHEVGVGRLLSAPMSHEISSSCVSAHLERKRDIAI